MVYSYLSTAIDISKNKLEHKSSWQYSVKLFLSSLSNPVDPSLPLMKDSTGQTKPVDWNYPNRTWPYYSHILAGAYGWTLDYIADLNVNDALAHIQEVLTTEHLDREFERSLSEVAYRYDKSTKKSIYVPMDRPYWMRVKRKEIKKTKMKRSLLPVGMGVDISGLPDEYGAKDVIESGH